VRRRPEAPECRCLRPTCCCRAAHHRACL